MKPDDHIKDRIESTWNQDAVRDACDEFDREWPQFAPYHGKLVHDIPEDEFLDLCGLLTISHEGFTPHLYCDTVGLVSCGIGMMVDLNPKDNADLRPKMLELAWTIGGRPARHQELNADWDACKARFHEEGAEWATRYEPLTKARITKKEALRVARAQLAKARDLLFNKNVPNTRQHEAGWSQVPVFMAVVCTDMAFGLGNGGFNKHVNCNRSMKEKDWAAAAKESWMTGASYKTQMMHYMLLKACGEKPSASASVAPSTKKSTSVTHASEPYGPPTPPKRFQMPPFGFEVEVKPVKAKPRKVLAPEPMVKAAPSPGAGSEADTHDAGVTLQRVLTIPSLSQGNPANPESGKWCGRTSAAMVHNYLRVSGGHDDLVVNSHGRGDLVYPDGTVAASNYMLYEPLNRAKQGWRYPRPQLFPKGPGRKLPASEADVRAILQPVVSSIDRNTPVVACTGISLNRTTSRHIVVFSGYRVRDGILWLHVDDPSTMTFGAGQKGDLLGASNVEVLEPGVWQRSGSRYWLRGSALFLPNTCSEVKDDLWCDHQDTPGLEVFLHDDPTPASSSVRVQRGARTSLPLDLGAGAAPTPAALQAAFEHIDAGDPPGGTFPLGGNGLWHGGVHVRAAEGGLVRALADGEVVCARLSGDAAARGPFGSTNFIIVRHVVPGRTLNEVNGDAGRVGLRARQARMLRAFASLSDEAKMGCLAPGDELRILDPEPRSADGCQWLQVTCTKSSVPGLQGRDGFVALGGEAWEDLCGAPSRAFDDGAAVPWYSLYVHLGVERLAADNPHLKDIPWLSAQVDDRPLTGSVGVGGKNALEDVRRVEELLRRHGKDTGPVDGVCDAATIAAIKALQGGWSAAPDGCIDPGGRSWKELNSAPKGPDPGLLGTLGSVTAVGRKVQAGEPLWTVGPLGDAADPTAGFGAQVEAFSAQNLFPSWRGVEDPAVGLNGDPQAIVKLLGVDLGILGAEPSPGAIARFYREDHDSSDLRWMACRFTSEWAVDPAEAERALAPRFVTHRLAERLAPYSFHAEAARVTELPPASCWRYHPLAVVAACGDGGRALARRPVQVERRAVTPVTPATAAEGVDATKAATETPGAKPTLVTRAGRRVRHFDQGDARWASVTSGASAPSRRFGSAVASLAMVLDYYGREVDPGILSRFVYDLHAFEGDELRWDELVDCGRAADVAAPASSASGLGAKVLEHARSRSGGGYDWSDANPYGTPEDFSWDGKPILVKGNGKAHCCGFTTWVALEVAKAQGLLAGKPASALRTFQRTMFGANESAEGRKMPGLALPALGIGVEVPFDDAQPGDFLQIWRSSGSGHSVIFLGWEEDAAGKRVGVRYRSCQTGTDGIGDTHEKFVASGGKVDPKLCAVARMTGSAPAPVKKAGGLELRHGGTISDAAELERVLADRVARGLPTLARIDLTTDEDEAVDLFVVVVGRDGAGRPIINDPSSDEGDGASAPQQNVIGGPGRAGTYRIVSLETIDPVGDATPETAAQPAPSTSVAAPYGGYELRKDDADDTHTWGGVARPADPGAHVAELQRDLLGLGYWTSRAGFEGGMGADGGLGARTVAAVLLFQREHGLAQTGRVDAATAQAIKSKPQGSYRRPGHAPKHLPTASFVELPASRRYTRAGDVTEDAQLIRQDEWGTPELVGALVKAGEAWAAKGKPPFAIDDMALYDGGAFPPHDAHEDGNAADVVCDIRSASFDKQAALELAQTFVDAGVQRILFNCQYVIDNLPQVKACPKHDDHMHLDMLDRPQAPKLDAACLRCAVHGTCDHPGKVSPPANEVTFEPAASYLTTPLTEVDKIYGVLYDSALGRLRRDGHDGAVFASDETYYQSADKHLATFTKLTSSQRSLVEMARRAAREASYDAQVRARVPGAGITWSARSLDSGAATFCPTLKVRVEHFHAFLHAAGLYTAARFAPGGEGTVREAKTAHKWSVEYTLLAVASEKEKILDNLVAMYGDARFTSDPSHVGCIVDLDGNPWAMKSHFVNAAGAKVTDVAKIDRAKTWANVRAYVDKFNYRSNKTSPASEGYARGSDHRLPNTAAANVSKHCSGHAIDLSSEQFLSKEDPIIDFVAWQFGLMRTVGGARREAWHFERTGRPIANG